MTPPHCLLDTNEIPHLLEALLDLKRLTPLYSSSAKHHRLIAVVPIGTFQISGNNKLTCFLSTYLFRSPIRIVPLSKLFTSQEHLLLLSGVIIWSAIRKTTRYVHSLLYVVTGGRFESDRTSSSR